MIQAVLFDCDGVLMDTERLAHKINAELLRESGSDIAYEDHIAELHGKTTDGVREWLEQQTGEKITDWPEREAVWMKRFHQALLQVKPLMPGIEQLLQDIQVPIAVVSNSGADNLLYKIKNTGLERYFSERQQFSAADLKVAKPHPGGYLAAAESLGVKPENCIVIEDAVIGVHAGVAAGMTVWAYAHDVSAEELKQAGAARCFEHLSQVSEWLTATNL